VLEQKIFGINAPPTGKPFLHVCSLYRKSHSAPTWYIELD